MILGGKCIACEGSGFALLRERVGPEMLVGPPWLMKHWRASAGLVDADANDHVKTASSAATTFVHGDRYS